MYLKIIYRKFCGEKDIFVYSKKRQKAKVPTSKRGNLGAGGTMLYFAGTVLFLW